MKTSELFHDFGIFDRGIPIYRHSISAGWYM